jgi:hypothetical protein
MASPREMLCIDMDSAPAILSSVGSIGKHDDMMIVMSWKGMEVTVYPQGKVMFHPLEERETAIAYADEILRMLVG